MFKVSMKNFEHQFNFHVVFFIYVYILARGRTAVAAAAEEIKTNFLMGYKC